MAVSVTAPLTPEMAVGTFTGLWAMYCLEPEPRRRSALKVFMYAVGEDMRVQGFYESFTDWAEKLPGYNKQREVWTQGGV